MGLFDFFKKKERDYDAELIYKLFTKEELEVAMQLGIETRIGECSNHDIYLRISSAGYANGNRPYIDAWFANDKKQTVSILYGESGLASNFDLIVRALKEIREKCRKELTSRKEADRIRPNYKAILENRLDNFKE